MSLIQAAQLFLSLSILVILHELGHFIPAKLFKTKVEKFYLFFNPWFSLFKFKWKGTEYGLGWLPLGGYVKISGMIDESMDKEQLDNAPQPWEFRSKSAWQRLVIMLGGIFVNIVVAIILFTMIPYIWGSKEVVRSEGLYVNPVLNQYGIQTGDDILEIDGEPMTGLGAVNQEVMLFNGQDLLIQKASGEKVLVKLPDDVEYEIMESNMMVAFGLPMHVVFDSISDGAAKGAGILKGDSVMAINGVHGLYWQDFSRVVQKGEKVSLLISRGGDSILIDVVPEKNENGQFKVGVGNNGDVSRWYEIKDKEYSLMESLSEGVGGSWNRFIGHAYSMKFLATKKGVGQVGSVIKMGQMFSKEEWNWPSFWSLTGYLSIVLAFMNLLPIPALDGGHAMFTLYEIVFRRKPGKQFLEKAQLIGMVILLSLMVVVLSKDIIEAIFN